MARDIQIIESGDGGRSSLFTVKRLRAEGEEPLSSADKQALDALSLSKGYWGAGVVLGSEQIVEGHREFNCKFYKD